MMENKILDKALSNLAAIADGVKALNPTASDKNEEKTTVNALGEMLSAVCTAASELKDELTASVKNKINETDSEPAQPETTANDESAQPEAPDIEDANIGEAFIACEKQDGTASVVALAGDMDTINYICQLVDNDQNGCNGPCCCGIGIERAFVNKDNVLVMRFDDGTKTIAMCDAEDEFNIITGASIALLKKLIGNNNFHEFITNMVPQIKYLPDKPKKKKPKKTADETAETKTSDTKKKSTAKTSGAKKKTTAKKPTAKAAKAAK